MSGAKPEDEWGVTPDEGMAVPIDEEGYKAIIQLWQKASFPVISGQNQAPESSTSGNPSSEVDPQLKRAIEVLRKVKNPIDAPIQAEVLKAA